MATHSTQSPFALTAPDSLWRYACAHYADRHIASACLTLQEHAGADVCELLWLGWLYRLGLTPDAHVDEVLAPIRDHQAHQTYRLRAKRRALKPLARPGSPLADWRERLKRAELRAEREALDQLQALTQRGTGVRPRRAMDDDLSTCLARHVGANDAAAQHALATLVRGLQPETSWIKLSRYPPRVE